ncbi:acyl-CoA dehydrogenase family protein [Bosea sp. (in: a-proteobacteria)]|uniref:acyl-CoA dehydrogenase family protein n=1 Tax=Bosea sp. (in: a-proteobacteria) TaxID=1871050 RepID=UPI0039C88CFE
MAIWRRGGWRIFAPSTASLEGRAGHAAPLLNAEIYDQTRYCQMGALGPFGITAPEEHGGAGLDTQAHSIVMEELSRGYAPSPTTATSSNWSARC